ncbi:MAG: DUF2232 domain-containing protein [Oligoflexia bacterium]|nr:DUF2232 domain-containing protein [Oligoflexia bacterium]
MAYLNQNEPNTYSKFRNPTPTFLGGISVFLSLSFIFAIITPTPLALISIFQGRTRGLMFHLLFLLIVFVLATKVFSEPLIFWTYLSAIIFSLLISETILRGFSPIKGLLTSSAIFVAVLSLIISVWSLNIQGTFKDYVIKKVEHISAEFKKNEKKYFPQKNKDARETAIVFSKPELLAEEIIKTLPLTIFVGIIFSLWANLALLLRFLIRYGNPTNYPYSIKDLLYFKVPDYFIWPLITLLVLMLSGSYINQNVGIIAKNLLFCLGLFYFFQGFGILIELFNLLKLDGIFRSLLIVLTVVTSYWILALVGLFDLWVDFRALLNKKFKERAEEKENELEEDDEDNEDDDNDNDDDDKDKKDKKDKNEKNNKNNINDKNEKK